VEEEEELEEDPESGSSVCRTVWFPTLDYLT
jgi:hypothetical protein